MRVERAPWLGLGFALLLVGLWAGLVRLGWAWPVVPPPLPLAHGPLMVGGFLGVVIGLERAVGLGQRWAYVVPLLAGSGAVLTALLPGQWAGPLLLTLASVGLVAVTVQIMRIQLALFTGVLGLAALSWAVGNGAWLLGATIPQVVLWWVGFLVLTIAGERLELSRFLRTPVWANALFAVLVGMLLVGMAVGLTSFAWGVWISGAGWLLLAAWLFYFDVARRRLRAQGQGHYMALALLLGFGWLAVGGALALLHNGAPAGPHYDALLHAVLVGFVFSMIFAHVLIILPAVLGVDLPFHRHFYYPLLALQVSLAVRVVGDLLPFWPGRLWGGLLTALVMLWFLVNTARAVRRRTEVSHAAAHAPVR